MKLNKELTCQEQSSPFSTNKDLCESFAHFSHNAFTRGSTLILEAMMTEIKKNNVKLIQKTCKMFVLDFHKFGNKPLTTQH